MKHTKMTEKLKNILIKTASVIMILIQLGLVGVLLWADFTSPFYMISLVWLVMLPVVGLGVNWFIGPFFGDKYYNTGWVVEGRSVYDVEKTQKYYARRMYLCFIECSLFALLIVRYIFLISASSTIAIIGIIGAIIGFILYFIFGMSSYEQSGLKEKREIQKIVKETLPSSQTKKNKSIHKFKFEQYPSLLKKYETYIQLNSKKYTLKNEEDKKQNAKEVDKALDSLALSVYKIFNDIKPELIIKKTGEKIKWEKVINKPFEELAYIEKVTLVRLLDRLYKYVLPDSYYNL